MHTRSFKRRLGFNQPFDWSQGHIIVFGEFWDLLPAEAGWISRLQSGNSTEQATTKIRFVKMTVFWIF